MTKQILMIHEIKEKYFSLYLENYILTFDDALYSVYYYKDIIKNLNTQKIIFIPTGRILKERKEEPKFDDCYKANILWTNYRDNSNYMTIDEIKDLLKLGFEIGGHSHFHEKWERDLFKKIGYKSSLILKGQKFINKDTDLMIKWFMDNIGYVPDKYAFPFNEENDILINYLENKGFKYFYGKGRIDIQLLEE